MMGHIRQRGNAWEIRAFSGIDPVTGRKKYLTRTVKGSHKEAERALAHLPEWRLSQRVAFLRCGSQRRTGEVSTYGAVLELTGFPPQSSGWPKLKQRSVRGLSKVKGADLLFS
jgi:hypothetical protein